MSAELPGYVTRLFWDVRPDSVDVRRHHKWLIRRVLDWGDAVAIRWLRATYSDDEIRDVVKERRGLAHKTWVFWMTYFGLDQGAHV